MGNRIELFVFFKCFLKTKIQYEKIKIYKTMFKYAAILVREKYFNNEILWV